MVSKFKGSSSNSISLLLSKGRVSYPHKRVVISLEHLESCGYVTHEEIKQKSQTQKNWSVTSLGILMLVLYNIKNPYNIVKQNTDRLFFRFIQILINSGKKDYVDELFYRLKTIFNNPSVIRQVALEWFCEKRKKIIDLDIDKEKYPELHDFKKQAYWDDMKIASLRALPKHANMKMSQVAQTWLDEI